MVDAVARLYHGVIECIPEMTGQVITSGSQRRDRAIGEASGIGAQLESLPQLGTSFRATVALQHTYEASV